MIIPNHLQIETINGVCTARCTMCAFKNWTRSPEIMHPNNFRKVLTAFLPYLEKIDYLSLFGFGEPLLDKGIALKVKIASDMGYKSIGIATNCTELSAAMSEDLIVAGLNTLICSIDGATKETHESIRVGTNFDDVVWSVIRFMYMRNQLSAKVKVILRFVRQQANAHEWETYKDWWEERLDKSYGDAVLSLDVVDCDGKVEDYANKDVLDGIPVPKMCDQLYNRILVLSNGDVALCCGDDAGKFNIGNVYSEDPIEIYNNKFFNSYRHRMEEGKIDELDLCNTCTIPRTLARKEKV